MIGACRSIIYLNSVRDVTPVAIAIQQLGLTSSSYHGRNMYGHDKVKAMDHWSGSNSKIQVIMDKLVVRFHSNQFLLIRLWYVPLLLAWGFIFLTLTLS